MKKITIIFSILLLLIATNYCTGPAGPAGEDGKDGTDNPMDKQIVYSFAIIPNTYNHVYGETGEMILIHYPIIKFNIDHYIGVDSVIFISDIYVSYFDDNYFPVDLFNLTDSIPILNSSLKNTYAGKHSLDLERVESKNIFSSLPKKEIDIAIRIKLANSVGWNSLLINKGWLILYRK